MPEETQNWWADSPLAQPETPDDWWKDQPLAEDTWGEAFGKAGRNIGPSTMSGATGIGQTILQAGDISQLLSAKISDEMEMNRLRDEKTTGPAEWLLNRADRVKVAGKGALENISFLQTALPSAIARAVDPSLPSELNAVQDDAQAEMQKNAIVTRNPLKEIMGVGVTSLGQNILPMAGAVLTKNPAVALAPMSLLSAGQEYSNLRDAGYNPYEALVPAAGYGGAEAIGEGLPLEQMLKGSVGSIWKRVGKTALADSLGEGVTQALQSGIDLGTVNPDMTMEEFLHDMGISMGAGAVTGGPLGAMAHPFAERIDPSAPPAVPGEDLVSLQDLIDQESVPATAAPAPVVENSLSNPPTSPSVAPEAPSIVPPAPLVPTSAEVQDILSGNDDIESVIQKHDNIAAEQASAQALPISPEMPSVSPQLPPASPNAAQIIPSSPIVAPTLPAPPPATPFAADGLPEVSTQQKVDLASAEAASSPLNDLPEPTDPQKEAGNYKMGHTRLHGMDISIETPKGGTRSGVTEKGEPWAVTMQDHYGYIKRTKGADGDHLDVYVGPSPDAPQVFVIDQRDLGSSKFDESKAMLGYQTQDEALAAYRAGFSDGRGAERVMGVKPMTVQQFKEWSAKPQTRPASRVSAVPARVKRPITSVLPSGKARSILSFIKAHGGIKPSPSAVAELEMLDLGKHLMAGGLISRNGRELDTLREVASEQGYLPADTTEADFWNLIRKEALGKKVFRPEEEPLAEPVEDPDEKAYYEEMQRHLAEADTVEEVTELGDAWEPEIEATATGVAEDDDIPFDVEVFHGQEVAREETPAEPTQGEDAARPDGAPQAVTAEQEPREGSDQEAGAGDQGAEESINLPDPTGLSVGRLYALQRRLEKEFQNSDKFTDAQFEAMDNYARKLEHEVETRGKAEIKAKLQKKVIPSETPTNPVKKEEVTTEQTSQGSQIVIPGAEKVSDKELVERQMEGKKAPTRGQKTAGSDGGLFDIEGRKEQDMFDMSPAPMEAETPVKSQSNPAASTLEDVGEKIGGARKDISKGGLKVSDIEGLNATEAFNLVNKDAVWPKPDYKALAEDGGDRMLLRAIKHVRDNLQTSPLFDSDTSRRAFIEVVGKVRDMAAKAKSIEDVQNIGDILRARFKDLGEGKSSRELDKKTKENIFGAFKNTGDIDINYGDLRRIRLDVEEKNWPNIVGKKRTTAEGEPIIPSRPHLDSLERVGKDHRQGRNVTGDDFLKDFGFRGIEFGNWVANDERQKSVNLAYDALVDLADILNVKPEVLSLDGTLALAFGARGKGKAAAHYEPGKMVINLTKISGAGTLAHEWGHALDNYLGRLDVDVREDQGRPVFSTGGMKDYRKENTKNLRPEVSTALDDLIRTMKEKPVSKEEAVTQKSAFLKRYRENATRAEGTLEKARAAKWPEASIKMHEKTVENYQDWIKSAEESLRRIESGEETPTGGAFTSFYKEAKRGTKTQGGKGMLPYYEQPTEMFARTFEAYVFDKMAAADQKSQYLVHSVEGDRYSDREFYRMNPYPSGDERAALNKAYDKLFAAFKTRTGKSGKETLYQRRKGKASSAEGTIVIDSEGTRVRMLAAMDDKLTQSAHRIQKEMERLAGDGVKIRFVQDIIPSDGGKVGGAYLTEEQREGTARIIYIALSGEEQLDFGAMYHEVIHFLKQTEAFSKDWDTLKSQAEKEWIEEYDIRTLYPDLTEEQMTEEAIAEAFKDFATGGRVGSMADRVFTRLRRFFDNIRRWLSGEGFGTWEDAFQRVASGKYRGGETRGVRGGESATRFLREDPTDEEIEENADAVAQRMGKDELEHADEQTRNDLERARRGGLLSSLQQGANVIFRSNDHVLHAIANSRSSATVAEIRRRLWHGSGQDINAGETLAEAVDNNSMKFLISLGKAIGEFSDKDRLTITKLLQNPTVKAEKRLVEGANAVRKVLDDHKKYLKDSGIEIKDIENYFPREYKMDEILSNQKDFLRRAKDAYLDTYGDELAEQGDLFPGMSAEEVAQEMAEQWLTNIRLRAAGIGMDDNIRDVVNAIPSTNHLKSRSLSKKADDLMRPYLEQDPIAAIAPMILRTVRHVEFNKRFGPDEWKKFTKGMIADGLNGQEMAHVKAAVLSSAHALPAGRFKDLASWVRLFTFLTYLPRATVTSISEVAIAGIRTREVTNSFRSLVYSLQSLAHMKNVQEAQEIAEDVLSLIGEVAEDMLMSVRANGGMLENKKAQNLSTKFFRSVGLTQWTNATRVAAVKIGQRYLQRVAKDAISGPRQQSASRYLRELGIPKGQEKEFAEWVGKNGLGVDSLTATENKAMTDMARVALGRFVKQIIMHPTAAERQYLAQTPWGNIVYSLQAYTMSFSKNVLMRDAHLAAEAFKGAKEKLQGGESEYTWQDIYSLMPSALAYSLLLAATAGISELRDKVLFNNPAMADQTDVQKATKIISRSGLTGGFDPYINLILQAKFQRDPATVLSGPFFGGVSELFKAAASLAFNDTKTNTNERNLARAVYNTVVQPVGNTIGLLMPSYLGAAWVQAVSHPQTREAFMTAVAGPDKRKKKNKR